MDVGISGPGIVASVPDAVGDVEFATSGRARALHGRHFGRRPRQASGRSLAAQAGLRLRITTPLAVVIDEANVQVVSAEDAGGGFGIQPHHADFLTSLAVGVVSWRDHAGARRYCAVHDGVLSITGGSEVAIATREAIPGDDLATLDQAIRARCDAGEAATQAGGGDGSELPLRAIGEIVRNLRPACAGPRTDRDPVP